VRRDDVVPKNEAESGNRDDQDNCGEDVESHVSAPRHLDDGHFAVLNVRVVLKGRFHCISPFEIDLTTTAVLGDKMKTEFSVNKKVLKFVLEMPPTRTS
jgi:hypothetical protein